MSNICEASVVIDAPIETVWSAMTDFAAYREWNPFVVHIDVLQGPMGVGARLRLHVDMQGSKTSAEELVTAWQTPGERAEMSYEFQGALRATGMVKVSRTQVLTSLGPNQTRYDTRERFGGMLWRFVPLKKIRHGTDAHASSLKSRAEALHAAGQAE